MSGLWLPPKGSYQGAFSHPPTALIHVLTQSGSPMWEKGCIAASSTLLRVLPREVTYVLRPRSHIPLLWPNDTWGWVPSHLLINLRFQGPRGQGPGKRPCQAGTLTWLGFL